MSVWKMIYSKVSTNDFVMSCGISLASRCHLCCAAIESFQHFFFYCKFFKCLWKWLMNKFNLSINPNSIVGWLDFCCHNKAHQASLVLCVEVINMLVKIWKTRNMVKHNKHLITPAIVIDWIMHQVKMSGNSTSKAANISMLDFYFIKVCKVNILPPKAPSIKEVI
ncbi:unnamed protein product [Vicia faba]|uniref:Reverse transcriptase zinc-binding domain-containing protein n=1 Tax=Vicia faba TaxID=3906 RepID=A0AAV0ZIB4_VICFA|nr:unnamed protein product [Vicia faba]